MVNARPESTSWTLDHSVNSCTHYLWSGSDRRTGRVLWVSSLNLLMAVNVNWLSYKIRIDGMTSCLFHRHLINCLIPRSFFFFLSNFHLFFLFSLKVILYCIKIHFLTSWRHWIINEIKLIMCILFYCKKTNRCSHACRDQNLSHGHVE